VADLWIGSVKVQSIPTILPSLGLRIGRVNSFGPCPGCSAEQRGSDDRRGPCGMAKDLRGWQCKRCNIKGDALDLIARVRVGVGTRELSREQWGELREWCESQGWCNEVQTASPIATKNGKPKATRLDAMLGHSTRRKREVGPVQGKLDGSAGKGPFKWREGMAQECAERLWAPYKVRDSSDGHHVHDNPGFSQPSAAEPEDYAAMAVMDWLRDVRKFSEATIKEFQLGCIVIKEEPWLTIPLCDESERVVNVRFRSMPPAKKTYRVCPDRPLPLFGSDRLGNDLDEVLVTEGELDVMALWQYGYQKSVVSGTAGGETWKDEWLDQLEPYQHFKLCTDNDEVGNKSAATFADKMGVERCSRAILPRKDAGECLEQDVPVDSVSRCIERAESMFGVSFRRVDSYEGDIERLISRPDELKGLPTSSDNVNKLLGGLRPGVIVISGDTGSGKTTSGTWLCWDQSMKFGVPTAITSFENRPDYAVQKLLRMQLGGDFTAVSREDRAKAMSELGESPIHILHHYGHLPPAELMKSIRYVARRYGVKVVLIDHLGFLLDSDTDDKVGDIEAIIRALAITAYSVGVTLILICHPRGLPSGAKRITMNHIKGASAIKQDASDVIIIERDPPRPKAKPPRHWPASWWHFDKIRSEFGVAGSKCRLAFGPQSCIFADNWNETPEGLAGQILENS